jgi:hypothetical protein
VRFVRPRRRVRRCVAASVRAGGTDAPRRRQQKKCLDDGFANVKELAVGAEDAGVVVMARIDPANANWLGTCVLGAFKDSKPMKLAGAAEAWSLRTDVAAYVAWTASVFDDQPPAHGTVLATDERFRIAGEADLPSEKLAGEVEHELATSSLSAQIPRSGLSADDTQGLGRLVKALEVKRDRRGHRDSLGDGDAGREAAGEEEARLVSGGAQDRAEGREIPVVAGRLEAVGAAPLRVSAPQYFQYEVKAAKDGESAEIIARGDLDGNGKASELELVVKVERPSNVIRVSPSIHEIDPNE